MTLRRRLTWTVAALLLALAAGMAVVARGLGAVDSAYRESARWLAYSYVQKALRDNVEDYGRSLRYLALPASDARDEIAVLDGEIRAREAESRRLAASFGTAASAEEAVLDAELDAALALGARLRALSAAGRKADAAREWRAKGPALVQGLDREIARRGAAETDAARRAAERAARRRRFVTRWSVGVVVAFLALAAALLAPLVLGVERKLRLLEGGFADLSAGRLERRLEARSGDEFGRLLERFNRTAEDLRVSREQLVQAERLSAMGRLAGGVAHDFNNILTAILGYAGFLLEALPKDGPAWRDAKEIERAARRAATLTRQILAYSRKQILRPVAVDLNALTAGMSGMLERLLGEDVRVVVKPAAGLRAVRADPGQVEQVLLNLAVNARDAMPGGGTLTLATSNEDLARPLVHRYGEIPAGRYACLEVRDTGCGMTEEVKSHLFEPFFTTKGLARGTGLALAMIGGIAAQSGGGVLVDGEEGRGASFKVYLPVSDARPEAEPTPPPAPRGGGETILLVEDDAGTRAVSARGLAERGYQVLEAGDAEAALALVREGRGRVRLLVSDVVMPGMGGVELAGAFRALCPGVPVLLMSGHADHPALRGGAAGAAFLQKPFSAEALAARVREVLDAPAS